MKPPKFIRSSNTDQLSHLHSAVHITPQMHCVVVNTSVHKLLIIKFHNAMLM